jgi:hypothetical protein
MQYWAPGVRGCGELAVVAGPDRGVHARLRPPPSAGSEVRIIRRLRLLLLGLRQLDSEARPCETFADRSLELAVVGVGHEPKVWRSASALYRTTALLCSCVPASTYAADGLA